MLTTATARALAVCLVTPAAGLALSSPATASPAASLTAASSTTPSASSTGSTYQERVVARMGLSSVLKTADTGTRIATLRRTHLTAHARATATALVTGAHSVDRTFSDSRITRSSGLARSTYARDALYTHNDAGDTNRLFVVNSAGATRAVLRLTGARHQDWEDVASGPKNTLWVGDIGDDRRTRSQIVVYSVTEPRELPENGSEIKAAATRYTFTYPDGARDAETLLVHPRTGRLYVVSKASSGAAVYVAPSTLSTTSTNKLTRLAAAPAGITSGSFSPDGQRVVLTSATTVWTSATPGGAATVTALPARAQGKSAEVARDGARLLIGSTGVRSSVLSVTLPTAPATVPATPTRTPTPTLTPSPTPTPTVTPTPVSHPLAPAYVSSKTYFGTALSGSDGSIAQALSINDALFGKMPAVRQFDPTVPPEGAWSRRTVLNDRVLITSFREPPADILSGKYDARILRYFAEAPTQKPIFWSYFHEPEPHIVKGEFTTAEYKAAWRHVAALAGKAGKSNLYPTLILTGWTTEPASKRNWRDYYPGDEYISVVAWDPYNSATGTPTSYPDPAKLYASVLKASQESGKPWGIAETGSAFVPGDTGAGRAAWLTKVGDYFDAQGAAFVTYFQSNRDGNFKLTDAPSVAAWSTFVRGSTE